LPICWTRDFSTPIEEIIKVNNDDPDTVYTELTEYVATDRIKAEYERLFSAMGGCAEVAKRRRRGLDFWFSSAPANPPLRRPRIRSGDRDVRGTSASSLFLKQVESNRVSEYVQFLNQAVPYEIFMFDVQVDLSVQSNAEQIAEVMYRVLLRSLDYARTTTSPRWRLRWKEKASSGASRISANRYTRTTGERSGRGTRSSHAPARFCTS